MKRQKLQMALLVALTLVSATGLFAQASLTGELKGAVSLEDGSGVPGVLVTATSPSAQGARTTTTSASGQWILRNLPPGEYTVRYELEGMQTVQTTAGVDLGQATPMNITMGVEVQEETILVTGELPSTLTSSEISTTYDFETVNNLAVNRTPSGIASLAPGLTQNTPNGGQVTISGGFAYDNVFLIDGVDANDNLFGTPTQVYIEDAIADIQVLTSGISAEYGRFSGGVVNVITKSGGNEFSGTVRMDLDNPDWRNTTPLEDSRGTVLEDDISEVYSATLGGYVLKDKLWFFAAARDEASGFTDAFFATGLPELNSNTQDRLELKATGNIANRHQLQFTVTDRENTGIRPSFGSSGTPSTLRTRTDPASLEVGRYSGVLSESIFAEVQLSEKKFQFNNSHGLDADTTPGTQSFIDNSPFWDFYGNFGAHYNAPYFDGKDPEDRNNEQLAASVSFFQDSASAGTHDLKVGFEDFSSFRTGGNSQSPTDWVISADILYDANGDPLLSAAGEVTPVWGMGTPTVAINFLANRDAEIELNTQSAFINDSWQLNDHWSFNIGFRYEDVKGETASNIVTVDSDAFVPRLGLSYDLRGDGKVRFHATYAEYSGKYSETQFAENTQVGSPAELDYFYIGPPGVGLDFAPAYDFFNPDNYVVIFASDGTQNVFVDDNVSSPTVEEITLAGGTEFGKGGFIELVYTNREYSDFIEDFFEPGLGATDVVVQGNLAGTFDNQFISNTDFMTREYEAVQLIGRYRLTDKWTLDGNYTFQIKNDGNFEGEGQNTPGISSVFGNYMEIRSEAQHFPVGTLNDFAESKLRVWTNYFLDFGRGGNLNFGLLLNLDSGRTFSATDSWSVTPIQQELLAAANYPGVGAPRTQTLFFGDRGTVKFDDATTFDLSVNYQLPVFRDLNIWIKADIFNLFDDDTQIAGRSTVGGVGSGPLDALGLPTTFTPDSNFRDARNNADFVDPQEFRFTVGFRF